MPMTYLDFEKPIAELEAKITELEHLARQDRGLQITDELTRLKQKAISQLKDTYSSLSAWRKTQVARHPERLTSVIIWHNCLMIFRNSAATASMAMTTR